MKKYLAAFALAAAFAQPASAITFSKLTTIYVGSGVVDDGQVDNEGEATAIHCSNVSGVTVQVRALILNQIGSVAGNLTVNLEHGRTITFATHLTNTFIDTTLATGTVLQGVLNVEATNSAVFCTAIVLDAANDPTTFMSPLHLVRVNPHPGTVE